MIAELEGGERQPRLNPYKELTPAQDTELQAAYAEGLRKVLAATSVEEAVDALVEVHRKDRELVNDPNVAGACLRFETMLFHDRRFRFEKYEALIGVVMCDHEDGWGGD